MEEFQELLTLARTLLGESLLWREANLSESNVTDLCKLSRLAYTLVNVDIQRITTD